MTRDRLFIDGEFVEAASGATRPLIDPGTEEVLATLPLW
jgi:hypothetical protein